MRLCASVLVPLLLLALIEGGLRLAGFGDATDFFVDAGDGRTLTTNWKFAWQYHPRSRATSPPPVSFPREKTSGTLRVFVLGESAAAGTPDPAFGFIRQLDLMLHDQFPGNKFEVINAAMRGIDSHVVRRIALECAALSPDLFIVYLGNNDMIGLHAPEPDQFTLTSNIRWLRAKHALNRTRLAQLGRRALAGVAKPQAGPVQDQAFFRSKRVAFDDPLRTPNYRHFASNLRDICAAAEGAGARALVCPVAVNLRDFPPLASLHRRDLSKENLAQWEKLYEEGRVAEASGNLALALARYASAAQLDGHFAELHFRQARVSEAAARPDDARRHFRLARDWDAMQFRTDGRLNDLARSLATNGGPRVLLADVERHCATSALAENGVPGGKIFHEHVHFTFDGDHLVASALLVPAAAALGLSAPARPPLSRNECALRLAYTLMDDFNVRSGMARMTASPPFQDQLEHAARQAARERELQEINGRVTSDDFVAAEKTYRAALAARPDDTMIRFNFANLLNQLGRRDAAAAEFAQVVERRPAHREYRLALGRTLLELGRAREAAAQFEAVLKLDPGLQPARDGLAAARRKGN